MKIKNIKKYYKKRIVDGWRQYLTLNVKYSDVGLENKFLSRKMITELLQLEDTGEDSGFVDQYDFYDPNVIVDGIKQLVTVELRWNFLPEDKTINLPEYYHLPENTIYLIDDDKFYYIEGMCGFKNPKYVNSNNPNYDKNEPYWLFKGDKDLESYRYTWLLSNDNDSVTDENVYEVLKRFAANENFESDMFSGNWVYGLVSGNFGQNITNNLFDDLSKLSWYCKTNYEDFYDDHIELTYAIRYRDYTEPFLKDLKKIIKKYKVKF